MIIKELMINTTIAMLFLLIAIYFSLESASDTPQRILTANLNIRNVTLGNSNLTEQYRMITFDIDWAYSWRSSKSPNNWDAAWVFVKYQVSGGEWKHATLSTVSGEHRSPQRTTIDAPADGKGVYIYRSEDGTGRFNASGVSLRWNYGLDIGANNATVNVRVFGFEMVYIPQGSFYAGDNGTSCAALTKGSNDRRPWHITSEDAIEVTNTASDGYYYVSSKDFERHEWNVSEDETGTAFTIPAKFPKGFRAIYCMKYELTQQQYVDFLNTLTRKQASNRYDRANYNQFGYMIAESNGGYSTTHPYRACGFLSPADGFAYADWAGLRPMSELEFEKICRGSGNPPVNGEYAWGSTYCRNAVSVNGSESDRRHLTSIGATSLYKEGNYLPQFPLNSGIFFEVGKSRERCGATFYGVLDMSGNLNETCVSISNQYGRVFTYLNGDGELSPDGFANESAWPLRDGRGAGYRGGSIGRESEMVRVSDRLEAAVEIDNDHRHIPWGFRGVRTVSF
jgi:hypothetical protein